MVLSGNASDGTMGLKAIKAAGGIAFAQDEESAKFPGMPRSAIAAGFVDFVLAPEKIAAELGRLGAAPYVTAGKDREAEATKGDGLGRIFKLLRTTTGVDFANYRQTTIMRRIQRRANGAARRDAGGVFETPGKKSGGSAGALSRYPHSCDEFFPRTGILYFSARAGVSRIAQKPCDQMSQFACGCQAVRLVKKLIRSRSALWNFSESDRTVCESRFSERT